jgi:hypothetical protein
MPGVVSILLWEGIWDKRSPTSIFFYSFLLRILYRYSPYSVWVGRAIRSFESVLHRLASKGGAICIKILVRFHYSFFLRISSRNFVRCLRSIRTLNMEREHRYMGRYDNGRRTIPFFCPFCLHNKNLSPSKRISKTMNLLVVPITKSI